MLGQYSAYGPKVMFRLRGVILSGEALSLAVAGRLSVYTGSYRLSTFVQQMPDGKHSLE